MLKEARRLLRRGFVVRARKLLERAGALPPRGRLLLAESYYRLRLNSRAHTQAKKALPDVRAHLILGSLALDDADYALAEDEFRAASESARPGRLRARAPSGLAACTASQRLLARARRFAREATSLAPRDPAVLRDVSFLKDEEGKRCEALKYARLAGGTLTGFLARARILAEEGELDGALAELGVDPSGIGEVILTHMHFDHVEGLAAWPQRKVWVHRLETEAPYAQLVAGITEMAVLEVLDGEEGEIGPGVRWMLTPGHSDGLVSLLVDTDEGLIVIASDCVGPLPEYFEEMELPQDFGPEREVLLEQWRRIRALDPALVIPGHNPPVRLR